MGVVLKRLFMAFVSVAGIVILLSCAMGNGELDQVVKLEPPVFQSGSYTNAQGEHSAILQGKSITLVNREIEKVLFVPNTDMVLLQTEERKCDPVILYDYNNEKVVWDTVVSRGNKGWKCAGREHQRLLISSKKGTTNVIDLETGKLLMESEGKILDYELNDPISHYTILKSGSKYNLLDTDALESKPLTFPLKKVRFEEENYRQFSYEDGCVLQGKNQMIAIDFKHGSIWDYHYDSDVYGGGKKKEAMSQMLMYFTLVRLTEGARTYTDLFSNVVFHNGNCIFSLNRFLLCMNMETGEIVWEKNYKKQAFLTAVWLEDGELYLLSKGCASYASRVVYRYGQIFSDCLHEPYLKIYNAKTGKFIKRWEMDEKWGIRQVIHRNGKHYAITGKSIWNLSKTNGFERTEIETPQEMDWGKTLSFIDENVLAFNNKQKDYLLIEPDDDHFFIQSDLGIVRITADSCRVDKFYDGFWPLDDWGDRGNYIYRKLINIGDVSTKNEDGENNPWAEPRTYAHDIYIVLDRSMKSLFTIEVEDSDNICFGNDSIVQYDDDMITVCPIPDL